MSVAPIVRLERAGRALLVRAISLGMPTPRVSWPPDWADRPRRVLYLRYNRIGDMIMATGIIRAIATSHASLSVDVVASPANASVLDGNPHVRVVLPFARQEPRELPALLRAIRRAGYDAVVDGMATAPKPASALLMLASRSPYRVGLAGRGTSRVYTVPAGPTDPTAHHIEQMAALAAPFGVDPASADLRPELLLSSGERERAEREWARVAAGRSTAVSGASGRRLLVNVSAGKPWRRWPDERFAAALQHLRARDPALAIAVVGSPDEAESVARVASAGGAVAVRTRRVRDAMALVATADLVFTPDTSISHAASALGTPAVVMLPRHIAAFAPYRAAGRNVFCDGEEVRSIPLQSVLAALEEMLPASTAVRAGARG